MYVSICTPVQKGIVENFKNVSLLVQDAMILWSYGLYIFIEKDYITSVLRVV